MKKDKMILFEDFNLKSEPIHAEIAIKSLHIIIQFQMFHWQSISYREHKIFDDFINSFKEKSDLLVEVISGAYGRILLPVELNLPLRNYTDLDPVGFIDQAIDIYSVYKNNAVKNSPEIISIIDDILALFYQTKYLLSFN
jgi:hypothetical protein